MEEEGFSRLREALSLSRCYLEYGVGGSTVYACTVAGVPSVFAVESDLEWLVRVQASIASSRSSAHIEHCDLGEVGAWGRPLSMERVRDWWRYMASPWQVARKAGANPDTVLVDGRFRVASFLYSLIAAQPGTVILFDDYFDRPHYGLVEEFSVPTERCGRMAVFRVGGDLAVAEVVAQIARYSLVAD